MKIIMNGLMLLFVLISASISGQTTEQKQNWSGIYGYEDTDPIMYTLTIKDNNSCIYDAEGIQTFFRVSCKGQINGDKYEIYFIKTLEGDYYPADWIDKEQPIMTLYYKNKKLYTDEGQLNKEVKGGQLLFKKTSQRNKANN